MPNSGWENEMASPVENQVKLMVKSAPELVRTNNPMMRSPVCYLWTNVSVSGWLVGFRVFISYLLTVLGGNNLCSMFTI